MRNTAKDEARQAWMALADSRAGADTHGDRTGRFDVPTQFSIHPCAGGIRDRSVRGLILLVPETRRTANDPEGSLLSAVDAISNVPSVDAISGRSIC